MNKEKNVLTQWLYWFIFAVAVISVYKVLDNFTGIINWLKTLFEILTPFIVGILVAYILYIPSRKVETMYLKSKNKFINKRARKFGIFTVYVIVIIIAVIAIKVIIPIITQNVIDLATNLPMYYQSAMHLIQNLPENPIINKVDLQQILININIQQFINIENITQISKGVLGFATGILDFFIALIVSVYILLERTQIIRFFRSLTFALFKRSIYKNIGKYFRKTNEIFFKFLASQILDAIIVGILTTILMSLLGVKYAPLLGIFIGIFNLIPFIGAIIAVVASLVIILITGGVSQMLITGVLLIILQQIDANIINPKIVGNSLKLSPILIIFAVTISGAYFGILGMFVSVPIIAVIKILMQDYIKYKNSVKI